MINKVKNTILSLRSLKKFVGSEIFFEAAKSGLEHKILATPPSGKVLVLAPHPDDEAIGCGGAIKLHCLSSDKVKIVYLTDGSAGFPDSFRPTKKEKEKMARTREIEARVAAKTLGVDDLVFLHYLDGQLYSNRLIEKYFSQLLSNYKPDIIYVPSFLDQNSDHYEAARILVQAISHSKISAQILSYEIWSPVFANVLLKIDRVIEDKKKAISAFESQLKSRNYLEAAVALNRYRGSIFGAGEFAEAYFSSEAKLFVKLFGLVDLKSR